MRHPKIIVVLLFSLFTISFAYLNTERHAITHAQVDAARNLTPSASADDIAALVQGNSEFAFDLYQQIAANEDGNIVFSPYSISMAFAMLYAGAEGDTAAQMADVMHFNLPPDRFHTAFNALDLILQPTIAEPPPPSPMPLADRAPFPPQELTLNLANSLWGQQGMVFEQQYLDQITLNYGSRVNLVDFVNAPDIAHQTINDWIEQATNGKITGIPPREAITPMTRLVLANAIYFRANWTYQFYEENTIDGSFNLVDGNNVTVPLMVHRDGFKGCVRGDDFTALELSYGVAPITTAMLILIPDEGQYQQFETKISTDTITNVLWQIEFSPQITFIMPRFDFESEINLKAVLSNTEMASSFAIDADFRGISPETLFLDSASHKAIISVDERGTEASAVTSIGVTGSPIDPKTCGEEVIADRPFMFVIYHRDTKAILFLGRVMNPAA